MISLLKTLLIIFCVFVIGYFLLELSVFIYTLISLAIKKIFKLKDKENQEEFESEG